MDVLNRWVNNDTVMWTAAVVSFVLLVLVKPVAAVWVSERRDQTMRLLKVILFLVFFVLVLIPFLVLITGETVKGTPCGLYLLFFPLFCYYLGKNRGTESGRRSVTELVGLDTFDSIEDAQDRLYESRLRFPTRELVSASIISLSRERNAGGDPEDEDDIAPRRRFRHDSEVLDVVVEDL
jgi:hypothetical protein